LKNMAVGTRYVNVSQKIKGSWVSPKHLIQLVGR
jgi:hypothetical protein